MSGLPAIIGAHGWTAILLRANSKLPVSRNGHHRTTTDPDDIRRHHGNVGICGGTHAVLDVDKADLFEAMQAVLGRLRPTVETGSGKLHIYVQPVAGLPRSFFWRDAKVGEIVRLKTEYAVAPPSIHPNTGRLYRWLTDPLAPLPTLPDAWLAHLLNASVGEPAVERPAWIPEGDVTGTDIESDWDGPPADELLRRALGQPGARRRSFGVKFQCPGCRAEGHDRHRDNATVFLDGRWGCALDDSHRRAIGEALGIFHDDTPTIDGYDAPTLRRLGLRL